MNASARRAGAALTAIALLAPATGCSKGSEPAGTPATPVPSPSVLGAQIDREAQPAPPAPSGPIQATLPDGAGVEVVAGAAGVWVAGTEQVLRIDPATNKVTKRIDIGGLPTSLALTPTAVWATNFRMAETFQQDLVRIDPATNQVTLRIPAADVVQDLAAAENGVWMLIGGDLDRPAVKVVHVDPATGQVGATVELKGLSSVFVRIVAGPEGAFVMSGGKAPTLTHIRPDNRVGKTIRLPAPPSGGMVYESGAVWLVNRDSNTLTKVDAVHDKVVGTYPLPPLPAYLAAGGGRIWVTVDPTSVVSIDPATGAAGPVVAVDAEAAKDPNTEKRIKAIAADAGGLWAVTAVGAWRVRPG